MPLVISEHFVLKRLSLIRKSWLSNAFQKMGQDVSLKSIRQTKKNLTKEHKKQKYK
jgi:hypothetical protein